MGKLTRIPESIVRGIRLMSPTRYQEILGEVSSAAASKAHRQGFEAGMASFVQNTNRQQRRRIVREYGQKPVRS